MFSVALRHEVLLVDVRPSGRIASLGDESVQPWPAAGLRFLSDLLHAPEPSLDACRDKFDVGVVPRLLRLGLQDTATAVEVLSLLSRLVELLPEAAAEIYRSHLHLVRRLGRQGEPSEAAEAMAEHLESSCHFLVESSGDSVARHVESGGGDATARSDCPHYVLRFAEGASMVPLGAAPPLALARVVAFGCPPGRGECDTVLSGKFRTGGRLWCAALLLARALLADHLEKLSGRVVLEFGCGLGLAGAALAARAGPGGPARCVLSDFEATLVQAAAANLRYSGDLAASRGKAVALDARDLDAVARLAGAEGVTAVIGSDIVYTALSPQEVAKAACAALPNGGVLMLLLPLRHRPAMDELGLVEALREQGFQDVEQKAVEARDAHAILAEDDERGQEYALFTATLPEQTGQPREKRARLDG